MFSLNGECKGIAAYHIPFRVFAVVDLYGQVAQASIISYASLENIQTSVISTDLDTCKYNTCKIFIYLFIIYLSFNYNLHFYS